MTKPTSSPSASTTTSGVDGLPPTDPLYAYTFDELAEARGAREVALSDWRYALWYTKGRILHLIGLHTWVALEEWDVEHGSMQVIGVSCWHCPEVIRQ